MNTSTVLSKTDVQGLHLHLHEFLVAKGQLKGHHFQEVSLLPSPAFPSCSGWSLTALSTLADNCGADVGLGFEGRLPGPDWAGSLWHPGGQPPCLGCTLDAAAGAQLGSTPRARRGQAGFWDCCFHSPEHCQPPTPHVLFPAPAPGCSLSVLHDLPLCSFFLEGLIGAKRWGERAMGLAFCI